MAEKNIKSRIVLKHDVESNWQLATGFTPLKGEVIIYDIDSEHSYERIKIGDGVQNVNALPFVDDTKVDKVSGKGLSTNDYTTTEKNKLAGIATGANKTVVDSAMSSSSTNPVQNKVVNAAISAVSSLVGDTAVSSQINTAVGALETKINAKADSDHIHSAYVNQNAFSNVKVGSTTIAADSTTDTLTLVAGSNIAITPDATNDKITIAATDTVYTHPTSGVTAGTYKSVTVDNKGHVTGGSNPTTLSGYGITDAATKTHKHTASEVGADAAGSAANALDSANAYTDEQIEAMVGDEKVADQIATAIASKSDTGHTHDDRYYTESEINTKLSGKSDTGHNHDTAYAAKNHGNHVPATETANNAKFLRNDNTWQTVTPANIGAAASSHGTHVSYSTTAPVMDGTAAVGSASTVARSDHKHPTDTSRAAASDLTALQGLVGDTKVSTQIANAINGITHPVTSVNSKTGAVALVASDVGAVPTTRTVNGKALSSNITLSASDVGAADSSHGTHVTFSTTKPKVAGTASVGTATTVSRSDHVHPAQTSITGNAATATKATQDASGNVITSTYATKTELNAVSTLIGDTSVSEQIEAANIIYVGPDMPTDQNIKVWINTAEEGTGVIPVLPRVSTINLSKASWSGSTEPYSQVVSVNTVTASTKIDLQPTAQQIVSLQNAETSLMIENNGGVVTCYAIGNKPTVDYTIQVLLQEVSYV